MKRIFLKFILITWVFLAFSVGHSFQRYVEDLKEYFNLKSHLFALRFDEKLRKIKALNGSGLLNQFQSYTRDMPSQDKLYFEQYIGSADAQEENLPFFLKIDHFLVTNWLDPVKQWIIGANFIADPCSAFQIYETYQMLCRLAEKKGREMSWYFYTILSDNDYDPKVIHLLKGRQYSAQEICRKYKNALIFLEYLRNYYLKNLDVLPESYDEEVLRFSQKHLSDVFYRSTMDQKFVETLKSLRKQRVDALQNVLSCFQSQLGQTKKALDEVKKKLDLLFLKGKELEIEEKKIQEIEKIFPWQKEHNKKIQIFDAIKGKKSTLVCLGREIKKKEKFLEQLQRNYQNFAREKVIPFDPLAGDKNNFVFKIKAAQNLRNALEKTLDEEKKWTAYYQSLLKSDLLHPAKLKKILYELVLSSLDLKLYEYLGVWGSLFLESSNAINNAEKETHRMNLEMVGNLWGIDKLIAD